MDARETGIEQKYDAGKTPRGLLTYKLKLLEIHVCILNGHTMLFVKRICVRRPHTGFQQ